MRDDKHGTTFETNIDLDNALKVIRELRRKLAIIAPGIVIMQAGEKLATFGGIPCQIDW